MGKNLYTCVVTLLGFAQKIKYSIIHTHITYILYIYYKSTHRIIIVYVNILHVLNRYFIFFIIILYALFIIKVQDFILSDIRKP